MVDSTIGLPVDGPGKKCDAEQLLVQSVTVQRERDQIAGKADVEIAEVRNADPAGSDHGLVTREPGLADPKLATGLVATVVPGGTGSIDSTQISSGKTGKLYRFEASASVSFKVELQTVLNGAATTRLTRFGGPNEDVEWVTPHRDFIQQAEDVTAGLDGFRLLFTNLDTGVTGSDMHGNFYWDEVS